MNRKVLIEMNGCQKFGSGKDVTQCKIGKQIGTVALSEEGPTD